MTRPVFCAALIALAAPGVSPAQSAPEPIAPETWLKSDTTSCDWHACDREGSVRFAVTVSPSGRVTECEIIESSGNFRLDEMACCVMIRRARFTPATDANGHAIEGRWESNIRWKVPQAPSAGEPPAT